MVLGFGLRFALTDCMKGPVIDLRIAVACGGNSPRIVLATTVGRQKARELDILSGLYTSYRNSLIVLNRYMLNTRLLVNGDQSQ